MLFVTSSMVVYPAILADHRSDYGTIRQSNPDITVAKHAAVGKVQGTLFLGYA